MATTVRSYSKINLGLAIGRPRCDGFHSLLTLYQTLALYDRVVVSAHFARQTVIRIVSNHPQVPVDSRNTAWKMVDAVLRQIGRCAEVVVHIDKRLPVQGGLGAGSANAAATLQGLDEELGLRLGEATKLGLAAEVGSDVPLFLIGGAVLGQDRGQLVEPMPELQLQGRCSIDCVLAIPRVGVSTPAAFRAWDQQCTGPADPDRLQDSVQSGTMEQLSRTYASVLLSENKEAEPTESGASGIFPDPSFQGSSPQSDPEKLQGLSREQLHASLRLDGAMADESGIENDLAENSLLALVRTGIENDFESVVFPQYPLLREIKRQLTGDPADGNSAVYAALSGSGSALFGLYRTHADAEAAQQRVQQQGVAAVVTSTIPRTLYWAGMFAE